MENKWIETKITEEDVEYAIEYKFALGIVKARIRKYDNYYWSVTIKIDRDFYEVHERLDASERFDTKKKALKNLLEKYPTPAHVFGFAM